jgi:hypothetical protein
VLPFLSAANSTPAKPVALVGCKIAQRCRLVTAPFATAAQGAGCDPRRRLTLLDAVGGRAPMGRAIPSTGPSSGRPSATLTTDFTGAVSSGVRYACATIARRAGADWLYAPGRLHRAGRNGGGYFIGHVPQGHFVAAAQPGRPRSCSAVFMRCGRRPGLLQREQDRA